MRFLSVLILGLSIASTALAQTPPASLTVTGTGSVGAEPDMATITLGVTQQAATASAAMAQTSAQTLRILTGLEGAGIAARDVQTTNLSLQPNWVNRSSGRAQIDGYVAANTVMVRVRDLPALGEVLDKVVGLGANTFSGLSFGLQTPEPKQDEARRAAVLDAMRKAQLYAEAAGVNLGPVLSITEAGGATPRPMMMEAARSAVPVAAGEVSLSASVTVVFALTP